jgi:hypothetical protein
MKPFCKLRLAFTSNDCIYARFVIYAGWKLVGKEKFYKIGIVNQPAIFEGAS